jgi:hypothetical protein
MSQVQAATYCSAHDFEQSAIPPSHCSATCPHVTRTARPLTSVILCWHQVLLFSLETRGGFCMLSEASPRLAGIIGRCNRTAHAILTDVRYRLYGQLWMSLVAVFARGDMRRGQELADPRRPAPRPKTMSLRRPPQVRRRPANQVETETLRRAQVVRAHDRHPLARGERRQLRLLPQTAHAFWRRCRAETASAASPRSARGTARG